MAALNAVIEGRARIKASDFRAAPPIAGKPSPRGYGGEGIDSPFASAHSYRSSSSLVCAGASTT